MQQNCTFALLSVILTYHGFQMGSKQAAERQGESCCSLGKPQPASVGR
jgi:hypothetical protein